MLFTSTRSSPWAGHYHDKPLSLCSGTSGGLVIRVGALWNAFPNSNISSSKQRRVVGVDAGFGFTSSCSVYDSVEDSMECSLVAEFETGFTGCTFYRYRSRSGSHFSVVVASFAQANHCSAEGSDTDRAL